MGEHDNIQKWKNVYVFISSTFNDMHAERDYLIKKVFPELSEWCSERRLKLVDIDLRWGITEEDSMINKRVVDICLNRIDDCRPFFICFLGQRRGWIPGKDDVTKDTLNRKGMKDVIGKNSVTEIEVKHAVLEPFWDYRTEKMGVPVDNAFFFFRDEQYLEDIKDRPELMKIFTNLCEEDEKKADIALQECKINIEKVCNERNHAKPIIYTGKWDDTLTTPELYVPGLDERINKERCQGRLRDFTSLDGEELKDIIVSLLKEAISKEFPENINIAEDMQTDEIERELIQQDQFLNANLEGFIRRKDDFDSLNQYLDSNDNSLFAIVSEAGIGKTTLIANWVKELFNKEQDINICYRFIGASDHTDTINNVLESLRDEWKTRGMLDLDDEFYIENEDSLSSAEQMKKRFYKILSTIKEKTLIVIDSLNQLQDDLNPSSFLWLPSELPANIKMVVSFKIGDEQGNKFSQFLEKERGASIVSLQPFSSFEERKKLVEEYLSKHLKALDDEKLDALLEIEATKNPLFLKIILSELRIYGSFDTLLDKIKTDFGSSPKDAFVSVLKRMETDPAYCPLEPQLAVSSIFGLLSAARNGLSTSELVSAISKIVKKNGIECSLDGIEESVHLFLRQLRPFLAKRQNRVDFLYEAFDLAAQERYKEQEKFHHEILEQVFKEIADTNLNNRWEGKQVRAFQEMPYHMSRSGNHKELEALLKNYCWLYNKIGLCGIKEVIDDFNYLVSSAEEMRFIRRCLEQSSHILTRDREQLPIQLYGRMSEIKNESIEELLRQASMETRGIWLRPVKPIFGSVNDGIIGTLEGYVTDSNQLHLYKDRLVSIGYSNFDVWDINTHRLLFGNSLEYDNRAQAIVAGNKLISKTDYKVEVWNLDNGNKLASIDMDENNEILDLAASGGFLYIVKRKRIRKEPICYVERWNMDSWEYDGCIYEENIYSLSVFATDDYLIIDGEYINVIDLLSGKCRFSVSGRSLHNVYANQLIFEKYEENKVIIMGLNLEDGTVSNIFDFQYESEVREYDISLTRKYLLLSSNGKVGFWSLDKKRWIGKIASDETDFVQIAEYDEKLIIALNSEVYIMDEESGQILDKLEYKYLYPRTALVINDKLYSGTFTGKITIIDLLSSNESAAKPKTSVSDSCGDLAIYKDQIFAIDGEYIRIFDSKLKTLEESFYCNGNIKGCMLVDSYLIATTSSEENKIEQGYEPVQGLDISELLKYEGKSKKLYSVMIWDIESGQGFHILKDDDNSPSLNIYEDYLIIKTSKSTDVWHLATRERIFEYIYQNDIYKCAMMSFNETVFIGDGDSIYIFNIKDKKMRTEPLRLREIFPEEEEVLETKESDLFDIFGEPISSELDGLPDIFEESIPSELDDELTTFGNGFESFKTDLYYLDDTYKKDNLLIYKDNVIIQWKNSLKVINLESMEIKLDFPLRQSFVNHELFLHKNLLLAFHEGVVSIWNMDTLEMIIGYATPYSLECNICEFQDHIIIHTDKQTRILEKNSHNTSNVFEGYRLLRQENEKLFMVNDDTGEILVWNIEQNKEDYNFQVEYRGTIVDMRQASKDIWILDYKGSIVIFNSAKNIIESKVIFDKDSAMGTFISNWSGDVVENQNLIIDNCYFRRCSGDNKYQIVSGT